MNDASQTLRADVLAVGFGKAGKTGVDTVLYTILDYVAVDMCCCQAFRASSGVW